MESAASNVVCPVCTLYLRPGITLESHLSSHPKNKVIEALIKTTQQPAPALKLVNNECVPASSEQPSDSLENCWLQPTESVSTSMPQPPTNHSFIYQQFMSSSGTQPLINMNPMAQQFVAIPAVFNPQMFCPPYIFQQQQQVQILSAGASLPFIPRHAADLFPNAGTQLTASTVTDMTVRVESNSQTQKLAITDVSDKPDIVARCTKESATVSVQPSESVVFINDYTQASSIPPTLYKNERPDTPDSSIASTTNEQPALERNEFPPDTYDTKVITKDTSSTKQDETKCEAYTKMDNVDTEEAHEEDLNKACQTVQTIIYKDTITETLDITDEKEAIVLTVSTEVDKCTDIDLTANENAVFEENESMPAADPLQNKNAIVTSEKTVKLSKNDVNNSSSSSSSCSNTDVTILEMGDINFILPTDLLQTSIISKVERTECLTEVDTRNNSQVIMDIGEDKRSTSIINKGFIIDDKLDESLSRDSLNIRADERMPPRGELSEQESNGASEPGWSNKLYQEGSSGMSTSYDLLARESWEGSDCSDSEMPPLQSRVPPSVQYNPDADVDEVLIDRTTPPLNFLCSMCSETFRCPKERRVHQANAHASSTEHSVITSYIKKNHFQNYPMKNTLDIDEKPLLDIKTETNGEPREDVISTVDEPVNVKIEKDNFLCYTCGEMLFSQKELNVHNKKVHNIRPVFVKHECKICCETFPSEAKFSEHLKVHPLECNICGKYFYKVANLRLHQKRHLGVRPYKCDVCPKAFITSQNLQEHSNIHAGISPIKCTMCKESFRRYSNLVQHRKRYHLNIKKKVKDYVCPCGEVFHSLNKFNWHKEIHDAKPKSCRYCHEKFVHMASLTRHIRRAHNQRYVPEKHRENENVICQVCNRVYLKSSLDAHLLTHTGKKMHSCNICNKDFTTKWNLKLHKWTHATATSKPYRCDMCQSAFVRQSDYVAHINSHKSVRPYTCNYCGCKFIRKYNCLRHVREHEESKAYVCDVCSKSFHRSYYLKEHMRVHNGIRPFSCNICGKTSATKSNHNKHMKIHHARESISTEG